MAVPAERFFKVGDILSAARRVGCTIRVAEDTVRTPDGDVFNLRYLFAPDGVSSVPLVDLEDDERVPDSEVESWERRLLLRIPRPS